MLDMSPDMNGSIEAEEEFGDVTGLSSEIDRFGRLDYNQGQLEEESLSTASPGSVLRNRHRSNASEKLRDMMKTRSERGNFLGMNMEMTGIKELRQKRGRRMASTPSRSFNDTSPTPDKSQSLRKRLRMIETYEAKLMKGQVLGTTQMDLVRKKAIFQAELENLDQTSFSQLDKDYLGDTMMGDGLDNVQTRQAHCTQASSEETDLRAAGDMGQSAPTKRGSAYSQFVHKLIQSRGREMTETVNKPKKPQTALQMWEEDDQRRLEQLTIS
jgi:hypothetical protein